MVGRTNWVTAADAAFLLDSIIGLSGHIHKRSSLLQIMNTGQQVEESVQWLTLPAFPLDPVMSLN